MSADGEASSSASGEPAEILVFDPSPLIHFARQSWLGVLKSVVGDRMALIPDVVVDELTNSAAMDYRVRAALEADWIERRELRTAQELSAFARFSSLLVRNNRNRGEAGVLALAQTCGGTAVIDDGAGRHAAKSHGVRLRPTLALLCEAIRGDLLTVELVESLADDLLASQYRLPFPPGGFRSWGQEHNLF